MQFVDANIFLRHLTNDDPVKAQACYALFQKVQRGEIVITTSESILAEVVYVLTSKNLSYNVPRQQIRNLLYPIISMRGLKLTQKRIYLRALDLYAANTIDFEDALAVAHMERQKIAGIVSYDHHLDKIGTVTRREP
jgi:predicted nucleic acid-binding protein